jgi:hypothetical protein
VYVDATEWEEVDSTTTLEEEEEFRDEIDAELAQLLEEVSYTLPYVQMMPAELVMLEN